MKDASTYRQLELKFLIDERCKINSLLFFLTFYLGRGISEATIKGRFRMNIETQAKIKNIEERLLHMSRYL